jgi:hypothetical protein
MGVALRTSIDLSQSPDNVRRAGSEGTHSCPNGHPFCPIHIGTSAAEEQLHVFPGRLDRDGDDEERS